MIKSKIKWAAVLGILLSLFSLLVHLLLAKISNVSIVEYSAMAGLSQEFASLSGKRCIRHQKLWGLVKQLEPLQPYANPRSRYTVVEGKNNGFIYAKIYGGFASIRSSICDLVAISRLLNCTLIIPEIEVSSRSKSISSRFNSFSYIYNKEQFMASLANDVLILKSLPENFKAARRRNRLPTFKPKGMVDVNFYLTDVLPTLRRSHIVRLVISDGGCLQSILPPGMIEVQRLRCRVAFHALHFRPEIEVLGHQMVERLRAWGQPYLAFHPGLLRDTLAFHGCAELFQDLHTELIQYRRAQFIKHGTVKDKVAVESHIRKKNGSCPIMPEEIGVLLRAMGYPPKTIIYLAGSENFGGQRILIPLRAMFPNLLDHSTLCNRQELLNLFGSEVPLFSDAFLFPVAKSEQHVQETWNNAGARPRPLPPPPARPIYQHEKEGWYGWITETDTEPDPSPMDLRMQAHMLLLDALDYIVSVEADAFFPGFHNDGSQWPDFSSLVMGHRLYAIASSRTYRPDRKLIANLFNSTRDNIYHPDHNWTLFVQEHLNRSLGKDGLIRESLLSKPVSFLSHPLPECACRISPLESTEEVKSSDGRALYGLEETCPGWMRHNLDTVNSKSNVAEGDDTDFPDCEGSLEMQKSAEINDEHDDTVRNQELDGEMDPND